MTTRGSAPIAVALDASDVETAASWAHAVTPHVSMVKVGLQMFCRHGPDVVAVVRGGTGVGVFLDLKLHDIPVTVAGAVRSVARLRPRILTVHATGGAAMVRAAVAAADETAEGGTDAGAATDHRDHIRTVPAEHLQPDLDHGHVRGDRVRPAGRGFDVAGVEGNRDGSRTPGGHCSSSVLA